MILFYSIPLTLIPSQQAYIHAYYIITIWMKQNQNIKHIITPTRLRNKSKLFSEAVTTTTLLEGAT